MNFNFKTALNDPYFAYKEFAETTLKNAVISFKTCSDSLIQNLHRVQFKCVILPTDSRYAYFIQILFLDDDLSSCYPYVSERIWSKVEALNTIKAIRNHLKSIGYKIEELDIINKNKFLQNFCIEIN